MKRQVRVLTAHGRITGWILAGMPPALAAAMFVVAPEHMKMLITDPLGVQMIIGALTLQVIGTLIIRKLVEHSVLRTSERHDTRTLARARRPVRVGGAASPGSGVRLVLAGRSSEQRRLREVGRGRSAGRGSDRRSGSSDRADSIRGSSEIASNHSEVAEGNDPAAPPARGGRHSQLRRGRVLFGRASSTLPMLFAVAPL